MENQFYSTPEKADIFLTYNCDLRCPFCYYRLYQQKKYKDATLDSWLKLMDELKELGVMRVLLLGGEPLVYPGLTPLIQKIVASNMRFQVITNGVKMRSHGQAIIDNAKRCDFVQISIDGMEKTHDSMRGKGNWAKSIDALRWLKESGIKTKVNSVISSANLNEIPEFVNFLLEDVGVTDLRLNNVSSYEDAPLLDGIKALEAADMAKFIKITAELAEIHPNLSRHSKPFEILDIIRNPKKAGGENGHRQCSSLNTKLAFRADGAILPCLGCEDITLGHINQHSIKDVWQNSPTIKTFRNRMSHGKELTGECLDCQYNFFCSCDCPADTALAPQCVKLIEREIRKLEESTGCQII